MNNRQDSKAIEFNIDKQEFMQVFKIFDKQNEGEIQIQDVYELIHKFEANSNVNLASSEAEAKPKTQSKFNIGPIKSNSNVIHSRQTTKVATGSEKEGDKTYYSSRKNTFTKQGTNQKLLHDQTKAPQFKPPAQNA